MSEAALRIDCQGVPMVGVLHRPEQPKRRGVLMIVAGGPQYRVGGHRQLVLWSRRLAAEGYPTLRFDYRGVGDSYGEHRGYEFVDEDIRCALDRFTTEMPGLAEVVLWGECNAVSAMLFYAFRDPRVKGLVMLNPWVRTEAGQARALLRHYYLARLMQPSFWRKLVSGHFNPWMSARAALDLMRRSRSAAPAAAEPASGNPNPLAAALSRDLSLPDRMLAGLRLFGGRMLMVVSGRDLIAREFDDLLRGSPAWREQVEAKPLVRHDLPDADHTFSSAQQRGAVVDLALDWLHGW